MATRRGGDDSAEEEATAIDLRSSSQAFKKPSSAPSQPRDGARPHPRTIAPAAPAAPRKSPPTPLHSESGEDDEATEFLSARPGSRSSQGDGNASSLRARGRAVPLEGDGPPPERPEKSDARSRASLASLVPQVHAESTEPITAPELAVNVLPRAPRPLPDRMTEMKSETQTGSSAGGAKSAPRITRIFVDPDATHQKITADDAASETDPGANDVTDPHAEKQLARPLPAPAAMAPPPRVKTTRTPSEPTSETLEAEPADGTLIVEVPDGAVVFVDGIERGKGPSLKVKGVDRYAKLAVRIHCAGYLPWSGSVCLEGRTAAKIRPGLKKR